MIICKPKSNIQFALLGLLLLAYGVTFFLFGKIISGVQSTPLMIGIVVMLILTILFTIKVLMGYKTLIIDQPKITVKYLFRSYTFDIKALSSWEEIQIKTFNNQVFKQVDMVFGEQKVSFGQQEHTNYDKLIQFLKRYGKKGK